MKKVLILVCLFAGCTPIAEKSRQDSVVLREERGKVLTVLLDLSGSFEHHMLDNGKAFQFCQNIIDNYFRDSIGENDVLVIGTISGNHRSLLWQGTPMQLRTDFPSPDKLRDFLRGKADQPGSNVFSNLAESIEYVSSDPDVKSGVAKSAVFVLSDMDDNDPHQDAARARLKTALGEYSKQGGVIGCYYVRQDLVASCRRFLDEAGMQRSIVEGEIVGNPQLPFIE